jgi:hypothetical protein
MRYKDFDIEVFEDEPGKFKAAIRRPDGRPLGPAVPPNDPRATRLHHAQSASIGWL